MKIIGVISPFHLKAWDFTKARPEMADASRNVIYRNAASRRPIWLVGDYETWITMTSPLGAP